MRRRIRITLRFLFALVVCLALSWGGLIWYINTHKKEILQKITTQLSAQLGGTLTIGGLQPSLWKSFPNISLTLKNVTLQDTLWEHHHHRLLEVRDLYVKINSIKLLTHRTEIKKITASHWIIYLYTDSLGYANTYLLQPKESSGKGRQMLFHDFGLEDVQLYVVNVAKQKLFHLYIKTLDGNSTKRAGIMQMHIRTNAHVEQFAFNTTRGSYLQNKDLVLNIDLTYDLSKKELIIPDQRIRIGGEPIFFTGNFNFFQKPGTFAVRFHTSSIPSQTAVSWLSPNIIRKLNIYAFSHPIAVDAHISGLMQYQSIPRILSVVTVKDNELHTPLGDIKKLNLKVTYFNEAVAGKGHGDDNSLIRFEQVDGVWMDLPFHSDTLSLTNLLSPYVNMNLRSKFDLIKMNDIIGGNTFNFDGGTAEANLHYVGGILPDDTTSYTINGFVQVRNAGVTYLPRSLSFTGVGTDVLFEGDNLFLRNVVLHSRQSSLYMEGEALHFLRLYFTNPDKVNIAWRLKSPLINLNDFITFVGKRKEVAVRRRMPQTVSRVSTQLDRVLDASSIHLDASVDRMIFKNFAAGNIIARATLAHSGIIVEKVQLRNADGMLTFAGVIHQSERNNPFQMKAILDKVDVSGIFKSFDNFGQNAISASNLRGKLSATAEMAGQMTDDGKIIRNSMNGFVDFRLSDGELNNFTPFEKITRFAFKKRNLSHLTFKDIQNRLDISGNKIIIHPMTIESSAINMKVQGVYGMPKGTDIFLEIPLRNPSKEEAKTPFGKLLRTGKGFVLHLRAQDGDSNGVHISWDPLKYGRKATEGVVLPD